MRPALKSFANVQGGLVTRRQAVGADYSERELRSLTGAHGPWVTMRRGVYVERELWETADQYVGHALLRDRAAHLSMRTDHLLSHDSAARALGLPLHDVSPELSHITREGVGGSRTEHSVKHHLTRLGLLNTTISDGLPVTGLARTGVDMAREHGYLAGLVCCDAILRRGISRAGLEAELVTMCCWPGVTQARAAVADADEGAENSAETLTRVMVRELGIGVPETQFPVQTRGGVFWADLRVGCHLVEFDGRQKYRSLENGGVASKAVEQVLWDERTRQLQVCEQGLGMSRVTWPELFPPLRERTMDRLRREHHLTCQRFGFVLPAHLAEFAARMQSERARRNRG